MATANFVMLNLLHRFRRWAGVDRAVFFSNAAQMTRLVTGPITMALVLRYLTPEIQGYFYAFLGIVAMQVFLELGFSQNILQFASHEFAKLKFTPAQTVTGDPVAQSRLISLGRLALGYYAVAAVVFLLVVGIGGHIYFTICANHFSPASFKNPAALATQLAQPTNAISQFLSRQLSPKTRQALNDFQMDPAKLKPWQAGLSHDLNAVIKGESLFTVVQNSGVRLSPATTQLQQTQPHGHRLVRLNRLLLEAAYPDKISKSDVAWQGAWWLIVVTAAGALAINPAWSLLEGCNQIAVVARFRFWAALTSFAANALALIAGAGIYASALGAAFSLLFSAGYLVVRWRAFFCQFLHRPQHGEVSWAREIWPFQWRIAVSWLSGFFVFDILNPIAFYFCGEVEAGRLGMSLQLTRMIFNISWTWVGTKAPRFGMFVGTRAWQELDSLLRLSTIQSVIIYLLGVIGFLVSIPFIGQLLPTVPTRLAPFAVNAWLAGGNLIQLLAGCMAMELRAHRREPFMIISASNAVLTTIFVLILIQYWGITGEAMGYALAIWAVFIPAVRIYRVKRLEYRRETEALHAASAGSSSGSTFSGLS